MDAPLKPPFSFRSVPAITCCRVHVESSKGRWTMLLNLHSPHRRSATRFSLLVLVIVVVFVFSLPNFAQVGVSTGSVLGTVTRSQRCSDQRGQGYYYQQIHGADHYHYD